MGEKVKVNYSFSVTNSYCGTVEIDKDVYEHLMEERNEDDFAEMMGGYMYLDSPSDFWLDNVDVFEKA